MCFFVGDSQFISHSQLVRCSVWKAECNKRKCLQMCRIGSIHTHTQCYRSFFRFVQFFFSFFLFFYWTVSGYNWKRSPPDEDVTFYKSAIFSLLVFLSFGVLVCVCFCCLLPPILLHVVHFCGFTHLTVHRFVWFVEASNSLLSSGVGYSLSIFTPLHRNHSNLETYIETRESYRFDKMK